MGMSKTPTTSNRRTSFFLPSSRLSSGTGNKNLEVAALTLLWKLTEPKQGHSSKGLLIDPSLKNFQILGRSCSRKGTGGKRIDLLERKLIH